MLNNTKRSLKEIKERYDSAHLIIAKFGMDGEKVVCNQSMEDIPQLLASIESLKAITELKNEMLLDAETRILTVIESRDKLQDIKEAAVKGLEEISAYPKGNDLVYVRDIKDKAESTLSEIERLQNVSPS